MQRLGRVDDPRHQGVLGALWGIQPDDQYRAAVLAEEQGISAVQIGQDAAHAGSASDSVGDLSQQCLASGGSRVRRRRNPQKRNLRNRRLELPLKRFFHARGLAALQPDPGIEHLVDPSGKRQRGKRHHNPCREDQPAPAWGERWSIHPLMISRLQGLPAERASRRARLQPCCDDVDRTLRKSTPLLMAHRPGRRSPAGPLRRSRPRF